MHTDSDQSLVTRTIDIGSGFLVEAFVWASTKSLLTRNVSEPIREKKNKPICQNAQMPTYASTGEVEFMYTDEFKEFP